MKKNFYKVKYIGTFIMVIVIVTMSVFAEAGSEKYYDGILVEFDVIKNQLPYGTKEYITSNESVLKLNTELWMDKKIVVYGKPNMFNLRANDFKESVLNQDSELTMSDGYYENGGKRGEFRYHGFTATGGLFTNREFPDDEKLSIRFEDKKWIWRPWELKLTDKMSEYNYAALNGDEFSLELIENSYTKRIMLSTKQANQTDNPLNPDGSYKKYNYANILSPSDLDYNGEAKLWQETSDGRHFYQTFSTNKQKKKERTPVENRIEILDKESYELQEGIENVRVRISTTLLDDGFKSGINKIRYYNVNDIFNCHMTVEGEGILEKVVMKVTDPGASIVNGNSTFTKELKIKIDKRNLSDNVLKLKLTSYFEYKKDNISDLAQSMDSTVVGSGMICLYDVASVKLKHGESLTDINYVDLSKGRIRTYEFFIKEADEKEFTKLNAYGEPTDIKHDILKYAKRVVNGNRGSPNPVIFNTKQIIYDESGNQSEFRDDFVIGIEQPSIVDMQVEIPKDAYDMQQISPINKTDMSTVMKKEVFVDGRAVNHDVFFSGTYKIADTIGMLGQDNKVVNVIVNYYSADNVKSYVQQWVNVKTTLPKAQIAMSDISRMQVNRLVELSNDSVSINDSELLKAYPVSYSWEFISVEGDKGDIKLKDVNDNKQFIVKKAGFYEVKLHAKNRLGREDTYTWQGYFMPDRNPNGIFTIWNNVLIRGEKMNLTLDVVSLDGDKVVNESLKIYKLNEDGTLGNRIADIECKNPNYSVPNILGAYSLVYECDEEMGGQTLPEFLTEEDKLHLKIRRDFFVDNLRPVTDIEIDLPTKLAPVDVYIIGGADLDRPSSNTVRDSRVNYNNLLRLYGADAKVDYYDGYTYPFKTPVNTSQYFGGSYPLTSIPYSSNGYNGTLSRINVSDNIYRRDEGSYSSYTSCRTETVKIGSEGHIDFSCMKGPPAKSYSACYSIVPIYSTREICSTARSWNSNWVTYHRYTGYYSGDVWKYVKQHYVNPWRDNSDKYIVYIPGANMNLADFNYAIQKADAKVILIGSKVQESKVENVGFFIQRTEGIDVHMQSALEFIGKQNELQSYYVAEVGTTFTLSTAQLDAESDQMDVLGYQYIQDEIFDNKTGLEYFAKRTFDRNGFIQHKANVFNKVGRYKIYYKVKDSTGEVPFDKDSNLAQVSVIIHRPPVAEFQLEWDWEATKNAYKTKWIDKSFDPDYQFSRVDRGIIEKKISYRQVGTNDWVYRIPEYLNPGKEYEVKYMVKDVHGSWGTVTKSFRFESAPPIQIDFKLKALDEAFTIDSIPASEKLSVQDVWTRYPYNHYIINSVVNSVGDVVKGTLSTIQFEEGVTGNRTSNNTQWNSFPYEIPKALPDGSYKMRLEGIDPNRKGSNRFKEVGFVVSTPINLSPVIKKNMIAGYEELLKASTSKYVDNIIVKCLVGTSKEYTVNLNCVSVGDAKLWQLPIKLPKVEAGHYDFEFTATTSNGNVEVKSIKAYLIPFKIENLRINHITDPQWKSVFYNDDLEPKSLSNVGIGITDFPIWKNSTGSGIKLGYALRVCMDSVGLNEDGDAIELNAKFYAYDGEGYREVDLFVADDNSHKLKPISKSVFNEKSVQIVLDKSNRHNRESLPGEQYSTYVYDYYLPPHTVAVKKGENLDLINNNTQSGYLLVSFEVVGKKASGTMFDYTKLETLWGTSNGSSYGFNKVTGIDAHGKGKNHGDVFYYDLSSSAIDDLKVYREW